MNLLIVDDQEPVGAIVSRLADQLGWNSRFSTTANHVATTLQTDDIHLLMIDYALDGNPDSATTGLTVLESLRASGSKVLAVVITGHPGRVEADDCERLDILRVLAKPLSIQELRTTLELATRTFQNSQG